MQNIKYFICIFEIEFETLSRLFTDFLLTCSSFILIFVLAVYDVVLRLILFSKGENFEALRFLLSLIKFIFHDEYFQFHYKYY